MTDNQYTLNVYPDKSSNLKVPLELNPTKLAIASLYHQIRQMQSEQTTSFTHERYDAISTAHRRIDELTGGKA